MALDMKIDYDLAQANTTEKLVAQAISLNPADAAKYGKATTAYILRMIKAAMRVTAARKRKKILSIFENNDYSWKQHQKYSNWFGKMGSVSIAGLVAANRPKKTLTRAGNKRKRGYSKTGYIKPPKIYPMGGRLKRATRYKVTDTSMVVGVLPTNTVLNKKKMSLFQDGGDFKTYDPERSRRYLAALGIYIRRGTMLKSQPRPLYERLAVEEDMGKQFQVTFIEMLNDKLRVGNS